MLPMMIFVGLFCLFVKLGLDAWRAFVSPEFKRERRRLREQRQIRRCARRRK